MSTVEQRLFRTGPKRILALDGGGIRGVISLQILKRIERILQDEMGPDTRLSDYFDLIGGTSTGAIIATGLALGWKVDRILDTYQRLGKYVFQSEFFRRGLLRPKFDSSVLERELSNQFGSTTLGSSRLRTGLAVMLKRLDTLSPWIISNNPRGKYFAPRPGRTTIPNREYRLRDIVRASTAAPVYFEPESLSIASNKIGAFVDGGVSPHNNPALQLFMLATLDGYNFKWPTGQNKLMLVSIGTGRADNNLPAGDVMDMNTAKLGVRSLVSLMDDSSNLNETLLQWISASPTARPIDREIGDLQTDSLASKPLLTYLRYDARLEKQWLADQLNFSTSAAELESLAKMERASNFERLTEIGQRCGRRLVDPDHFAAAFKLSGGSADTLDKGRSEEGKGVNA